MLQNGKCPNCGANIAVDVSKDAAICEYCGSAFVVEKAVHNYNINTAQFNNATVNIERQKTNKEIEYEHFMALHKLQQEEWKDPQRRKEYYMMLGVCFILFLIFVFLARFVL